MSLGKNFETEISQESAEKLENSLFGVLINKHSLTNFDQTLTKYTIDIRKAKCNSDETKSTQKHRLRHKQANKHLMNKQKAKTDKQYTKTQLKQ